MKRENNKIANDIDLMLVKYPDLRVAYVDEVKHCTDTGIISKYYSVLVKAQPKSTADDYTIQECYRIRLPGKPIVGEGKPENQCHSIVFTRGEFIQTIDMNQSNTFEDALKLRNVLEEFSVSNPPTLVGIKENIFTGSFSSVASFMALQEGLFTNLGQRVLDTPLRSRFHYGHPDIFDKLWFITRGGISKASKGINLSEDIFAGYNNVLRGGNTKFTEYLSVGKGRDVGLQQLFQFEAKLAQGAAMQWLSRDVWRLMTQLDFFQVLSFFYSGM